MTLSDKLAVVYVKALKLFRNGVIRLSCLVLFKNKKEYKKILINRDGEFGDSVVALPALSIIRQNFPAAEIDLLCVNNSGVGFESFALQPGLINELISIKKAARLSTLKKLRGRNYELFIQLPQNLSLYKSIRNMLLVRFMLNVKSGFGWDHGRIKAFMRQQKQFLGTPTETQRFVTMLAQAGFKGHKNYPLLEKSPRDRNLLKLLERQAPVLFLIGGKLQAKKWPLENWITLAAKIGKRHKILIIGGENEKQEAAAIASKTENTINTCGLLSISELYFVCKRASLAVSLDTGAMHLCDAAGTRLVALISTRELTDKWLPINNCQAVILEKVLPCSFCLKTVCENNLCMKNISPQQVYEKVSGLLN